MISPDEAGGVSVKKVHKFHIFNGLNTASGILQPVLSWNWNYCIQNNYAVNQTYNQWSLSSHICGFANFPSPSVLLPTGIPPRDVQGTILWNENSDGYMYNDGQYNRFSDRGFWEIRTSMNNAYTTMIYDRPGPTSAQTNVKCIDERGCTALDYDGAHTPNVLPGQGSTEADLALEKYGEMSGYPGFAVYISKPRGYPEQMLWDPVIM